jgi:hypothetical protein
MAPAGGAIRNPISRNTRTSSFRAETPTHAYDPYAERGGGEVRVYRLELALDQIGEAFLVVSEHIDGKGG